MRSKEVKYHYAHICVFELVNCHMTITIALNEE